jgi:hypothetical protein
MQAYSPALPVGAQHYYRNSFDALRTIMRSDGVLGLWRGVDAAILRTAMVCHTVTCERKGELIYRRARPSSCRVTCSEKICWSSTWVGGMMASGRISSPAVSPVSAL